MCQREEPDTRHLPSRVSLVKSWRDWLISLKRADATPWLRPLNRSKIEKKKNILHINILEPFTNHGKVKKKNHYLNYFKALLDGRV